MTKKWIAILMVLFSLVVCGQALAGEAFEQLKGSIERILTLLQDPRLKTPEIKQERRNLIFKVVEERFDFTEMAKRSVGEYWNQLNEAQQKDFEVAFSNLLENSYITRIEKYSDEKVNYKSERPKGDRYVAVQTEIVSKGQPIPVDYSLHQVSGQWLVYDVNVEGVSLVTNYRSQFRETLQKGGFQGLMAKIAEKLSRLEEESGK